MPWKITTPCFYSKIFTGLLINKLIYSLLVITMIISSTPSTSATTTTIITNEQQYSSPPLPPPVCTCVWMLQLSSQPLIFSSNVYVLYKQNNIMFKTKKLKSMMW